MLPLGKSSVCATLTSATLPSVTCPKTGRYPSWSSSRCSLTAPLGLSEACPIEHARAQFNGGAVQAEQPVLELEFCFGTDGLALRQEIMEEPLEKFPRPVRIGIGKGGALGLLFQPQMLELALARSEPVGYLPQGAGLS